MTSRTMCVRSIFSFCFKSPVWSWMTWQCHVRTIPLSNQVWRGRRGGWFSRSLYVAVDATANMRIVSHWSSLKWTVFSSNKQATGPAVLQGEQKSAKMSIFGRLKINVDNMFINMSGITMDNTHKCRSWLYEQTSWLFRKIQKVVLNA